MIKVICDVNFHSSADFDKTSVIGIARAWEFSTVVDLVKRDVTDMYRLKSRGYITASKKYLGDFES